MTKYTPAGSVRIDTYRVQKSEDTSEKVLGFFCLIGLILLVYGCNAS